MFRTLAEVLNLGVDFVDEDELLLPTSLAKFKVLYVAEPDLPLAGGAALVAWVKSGGTLITVAGAGQFDEYDEPSAVFQTELFGSPEAGEETVVRFFTWKRSFCQDRPGTNIGKALKKESGVFVFLQRKLVTSPGLR